MGDAGEGLIDADARIQERMEELQLSRARAKRPVVKNPDQLREIESLKLARTGHATTLVVRSDLDTSSQLSDSSESASVTRSSDTGRRLPC